MALWFQKFGPVALGSGLEVRPHSRNVFYRELFTSWGQREGGEPPRLTMAPEPAPQVLTSSRQAPAPTGPPTAPAADAEGQ